MKATLVATLALVLVLPTASAQAPLADATVELKITPLEAALDRHATTVVPVVVLYHYSNLGLALGDTPIQLSIAEAPEWVVASFSPSVVRAHFYAPGPGPTSTSHAESLLSIAVVDAPAEGAVATLRIEALAEANGMYRQTRTSETVLLRVLPWIEGPCHHPEEAAEAPEPADSTLSTSTAGAAAGPASSLVAGAGAVGALAGVGVALALRRRR